MISKATVYVDGEGKAVTAGKNGSLRLLVREGCDIPAAKLEAIPGAMELAGGKKEKSKEAEGIETREPAVENREPHHRHKK